LKGRGLSVAANVPKSSGFILGTDLSDLTEVTIQDVYSALSNDALRNAIIADDIVR
jgi:hypothetical protein